MVPRSLQAAFNALLALSSIAPSLATSIVKRDGIIPTTLPGSWTSIGCYTDVGRTLTGGFSDSPNQTIETCINYCTSAGFTYAGTEYSSQCFCGNGIATNAVKAPNSCHMTCAGNHTEACGDASKLNIFFGGQTGPQTNPGPGLWSLLGCYAEGQTGRALPNGVTTQGGPLNMSIGACTTACQAAGYALAGAEYGQECWCGNGISSGATVAPEGISGCNIICKGNSSEFCGAGGRLDVYNFNGTYTAPTGTSTTTTTAPTAVPTAGNYSYYGCQSEGTGVRALSAKTTSSSVMTIEACRDFCFGYNLFGTEYGQECYCGNSLGAGSTQRPNSECNFVCPGNSGEICGAGNRLSVFVLNGVNVTSVAIPTSTPTSTAPPATIPTGWTSQGCWVDGKYGRILTGTQLNDSPENSVEACITACAAAQYTVAGVEYGAQCFCDNQIENGGTLAPAATDCNMACAGNSGEVCGGPNRINIYSLGTPAVNPPPTVQKKDLPGIWSYQGCLESVL